MTDTVNAETRSRIMSRVKSKNTNPEMRVRRALHAAGFRFRVHRKDLPGCPDLVLPKYRMVIFVHGCFWHWHGCENCRMPKTNVDFWQSKIDRNVARDAVNLKTLKRERWKAIIIWECEMEVGIHRTLNYLGRLKLKI